MMTERVAVDKREALKALRKEREPILEAAQQRLKEQNQIRREITKVLKEGPQTVPAVAMAAGIPTETVLWHLMAMKKYGLVVEVDLEEGGDYYLYRLGDK